MKPKYVKRANMWCVVEPSLNHKKVISQTIYWFHTQEDARLHHQSLQEKASEEAQQKAHTK